MLGSIRNWLYLVGLNLLVKQRNFIEFCKVIIRYYPNMTFAKIDLSLLIKYFFNSPFAISKEFMIKHGEEEVYVYGETPLTTFDHIAKICEFSSKDIVFELGCGRGRTCFWLAYFLGCKVVGIDYIPEFIQKGTEVKKRFLLDHVEFRQQDILKEDYATATAIYLYGTCYERRFIEKLIRRFSKCSPGTKIITVSYSLNEYTDKPLFEVVKKFSCTYTWGQADVYLQIKK